MNEETAHKKTLSCTKITELNKICINFVHVKMQTETQIKIGVMFREDVREGIIKRSTLLHVKT